MDSVSQVAPVIKNLSASTGDIRDAGLIPGLGRSPGRGHGNPVFLPRESHGQRSLAGYSPWGHKESDTTEHIHIYPLDGYLSYFHFHHYSSSSLIFLRGEYFPTFRDYFFRVKPFELEPWVQKMGLSSFSFGLLTTL